MRGTKKYSPQYKQVSVEVMTQWLTWADTALNLICDVNPVDLYNSYEGNWKGFGHDAYCWANNKYGFFLAFRFCGKSYNLRTELDGTDLDRLGKTINGRIASIIASRFVDKVSIDINPEENDKIEHASPIYYCNPNYSVIEMEDESVRSWCYDINKAYLSVMRDYQFPDFTSDFGPGVVQEGCVGFTLCVSGYQKPGQYAEHRYLLRPSPYKQFAEYVIEKQKEAKLANVDVAYWKGVPNSYIGNLVYHNNYMRNYIVTLCNERIQAIIDRHPNDILLANTDSVTSRKPLPELQIGPEVGQWKIEHDGYVSYISAHCYMWDDGTLKYSGLTALERKNITSMYQFFVHRLTERPESIYMFSYKLHTLVKREELVLQEAKDGKEEKIRRFKGIDYSQILRAV